MYASSMAFCREQLDARADQIVTRVGRLEVAELARIEQALDVLAQPKDRGLAVGATVSANPFEGP